MLEIINQQQSNNTTIMTYQKAEGVNNVIITQNRLPGSKAAGESG